MVGKLLGVVAADADRRGDVQVRDVLLNSEAEVMADTDFYEENWEQHHGHSIRLLVPPGIYMAVGLEQLDSLEQTIRERVNHVLRIRGEYIAAVELEITESPLAAGVLAPRPRDQDADLWGEEPEFVRMFVSHKADDRAAVTDLKDSCVRLGIYCFVAHRDIAPTAEWQGEILRALLSMDMLAAWLTLSFHDSDWTDQEVGAAIGRRVPVVPLKVGQDPYGLIGKYQALPAGNRSAAELSADIVSLSLGRLTPVCTKMQTALVRRFESADDYYHANELIKILDTIQAVSPDLVQRLETAPAGNAGVARAFDVQRRLPRLVARLRGKQP
ncbi:toll/interleukin-1 receptor domain-containing protein [bacterium]|nr:toll/interleukin-1 receptor domain-containing protein [bacterium]